MPKKALKRLIKAVENITAQNPEGTLIITWKLISVTEPLIIGSTAQSNRSDMKKLR